MELRAEMHALTLRSLDSVEGNSHSSQGGGVRRERGICLQQSVVLGTHQKNLPLFWNCLSIISMLKEN